MQETYLKTVLNGRADEQVSLWLFMDKMGDILLSRGHSFEEVTEVSQDLVTATERKRITLDEAVDKYAHLGATYARLQSWVKRGHLQVVGREKFSAPGGGKMLVYEDAVLFLLHNPPKRTGRPKVA